MRNPREIAIEERGLLVKKKAAAEKKEAEKAEAGRRAAEQAAAEHAAAERAAAERAAAERAAAEREATVRAKAERLAAEHKAAERAKAEQEEAVAMAAAWEVYAEQHKHNEDQLGVDTTPEEPVTRAAALMPTQGPMQTATVDQADEEPLMDYELQRRANIAENNQEYPPPHAEAVEVMHSNPSMQVTPTQDQTHTVIVKLMNYLNYLGRCQHAVSSLSAAVSAVSGSIRNNTHSK